MVLNFVKFDEKGLIPVITQDVNTGEVLMFAWMNRESFKQTLKTGMMTYWSRSRQQFWVKGETSGNIIKVVSIWKDCDSDTILVLARPTGPVCHTGNKTCF